LRCRARDLLGMKLHLLLLFLLLFSSSSLASCPLGCGCDDDTLAVSCLHTDLQVMPITLNPGVKQLVLKFNQFTKVDASLAFYPALTLLDLSSNKLSSLPAKVFQAQAKLKVLRLSENSLSSLLPKTFAGLQRLTHLSLRGNQLERLEVGVLSNLGHLTNLDLSNNQITELEESSLPSSVKVLELNSNRLSSLPKGLTDLPNLTHLSMGNNLLVQISFPPLPSLQQLDLSSNQLVDIPSSLPLPSLAWLNLARNRLKTVPSLPLPSLLSLSLSGNPITSLPPNSLSSSPSLASLNISHCPQLRDVEEGALVQIPFLISLDLSHNRYLDSLPPSSLPSSLQSLDLTNCAFTSLEPDSLPPSLDSLHLSDNPWHCSCSLAWLAKVIRNLLESSTEPMRRVRCLKPSQLHRRDIIAVDFKHCGGDDSDYGEEDELVVGEDGLVFLLTIVFVSLVLVMVVTLTALLLVRRCKSSSSSSSSGVSTLESDYRSLPYPGDVRRRGEEGLSNSLLSHNHI